MSPEVDADRVADRDDVDAGAIDDLRHLEVVRDNPDNLLPVPLHLMKHAGMVTVLVIVLPLGFNTNRINRPSRFSRG